MRNKQGLLRTASKDKINHCYQKTLLFMTDVANHFICLNGYSIILRLAYII